MPCFPPRRDPCLTAGSSTKTPTSLCKPPPLPAAHPGPGSHQQPPLPTAPEVGPLAAGLGWLGTAREAAGGPQAGFGGQRVALPAVSHQPGLAGGGWEEADSGHSSQDSSQGNGDLSRTSDSCSKSGSDSHSGASRELGHGAERWEPDRGGAAFPARTFGRGCPPFQEWCPPFPCSQSESPGAAGLGPPWPPGFLPARLASLPGQSCWGREGVRGGLPARGRVVGSAGSPGGHSAGPRPHRSVSPAQGGC